jgi:hypothetical protein
MCCPLDVPLSSQTKGVVCCAVLCAARAAVACVYEAESCTLDPVGYERYLKVL